MAYAMRAAGPGLPLWEIPELVDKPLSDPPPVLPIEEIGGSDDTVPPPSDMPAGESSMTEALQDSRARGYAEGWERGFAEGNQKGYAAATAAAEASNAVLTAAQSALAEDARRLAQIVVELSRPIAALDTAVEDAVTALALEVARCVIGSEVARGRDYLVRLIREALTKVPVELGAVKVVLNPVDRDVLSRLAPDIADGGALLVADDAVEPGGCRVVVETAAAPQKDLRWRPRTAEGIAQVDLSLATRWRAVMRTLFEEIDK